MSLTADMALLDLAVLEELGDEFLVDATPVTGIFQDSFVDQSGGENTVEGREILFTCRGSDLPALVQRETEFSNVEFGTYVFLRAEPDESGLTRCILGIP